MGRGGVDTIDGGAGDDVLRGGANDDIIKGGAGDDLIDGGDINLDRAADGKDTADYSDAPGRVTIDLTTQAPSRLAEKIVEVANDGYGSHDTLHSIDPTSPEVGLTVNAYAPGMSRRPEPMN